MGDSLNNKTVSMEGAYFYGLIALFIFFLFDRFVFNREFKFSSYFELKLATSISFTYFIALFIRFILIKIEKNIEDSMKLECDFDKLKEKYKGNEEKFVKLTNKKIIEEKFLNSVIKEEEEIVFPVIKEIFNDKEIDVEIRDNKDKIYEPPIEAKINYNKLFESHRHSNIYNSTCIRLDSFIVSQNDRNIILETSRTSYFNSLVTNRALDHDLSSGLTLRKIFEYKKSITELNKSSLSNHIGINGMIITNDNKFVFVRRSGKVSIGKNTLGCSFGAAVKYMEDEFIFNKEKLQAYIVKCIKGEIKLEIEDFILSSNFVGLYRDLVEGGKPQLLFYYKTDLTSDELNSQFIESLRKEKEEKQSKDLEIDGEKLVFIDVDSVRLYNDKIVKYEKQDNNKFRKIAEFESLPSTSASVAMIIEKLRLS